ncbi:MAG: sortase [Minisyncoccia bacterium]
MSFKELKIFLFIFIIFFLIAFFLFIGLGVFNIFAYKFKTFTQGVKEEITSVPPIFPQGEKPKEKSQEEILKEELESYFQEFSGKKVLILKKFGIKAPIIPVNQLDLNLIYKKLKEGVVLFPKTDPPGQGYSIIIGHSSQYPWEEGNYKTVFSLLSELEKGDKVFVIWENKGLVFEVEDKKIFLPWSEGGQTTEMVFPKEKKPILILQSCWPAGVAKKRLAVKTSLLFEYDFSRQK